MSVRSLRAVIVFDLGFGDAGKGVVTDALVRRIGARAVVRFNGGAQAGHNVVLPDGRHHTFSQLGAGSFTPGTRTVLSRFVVVHPTALLVEARRLAARGVGDPLASLSVSDRCLVTTPFHQAFGRLREMARGERAHGSCGVGVGETVLDALDGRAMTMGMLRDPYAARRALEELRDRKRAELSQQGATLPRDSHAAREIEIIESCDTIDTWLAAVAPLLAAGVVVPDVMLVRLLAEGPVVFEGAQGVLLDEHRGFHPHTTWSTCTPDNARALCREAGIADDEVLSFGVTRTYAVRHGPGPFPTETDALLAHAPEPHNDDAGMQGRFRRGWLDLVLLRYALAVSGRVDALALTHLDLLERRRNEGGLMVCDGYELAAEQPALLRAGGSALTSSELVVGTLGDLGHVERLGQALREVRPILRLAPSDAHAFAETVADRLGVPVGLQASGSTYQMVSLTRELRPSA